VSQAGPLAMRQMLAADATYLKDLLVLVIIICMITFGDDKNFLLCFLSHGQMNPKNG
jgi:hypothetical protein